MAEAAYKFTWNTNRIREIKRNVIDDTLALAYGIANEVQRGTPVESGNLINSIRVTDGKQGTIYVLAGGSWSGGNVPYGKRREYENNLHPDKKYFMHNGFDWAKSNWQKYYKGVTR
ncbi:MAG: hypothetical protein NC548_27205 [Lachnospiraceae bacterium]|nr:hypothetical protein [Lachnospiraceae bacterium]